MNYVSHLGNSYNPSPLGEPNSLPIPARLLRPLRCLPPSELQLRLTDVRRPTDGPHNIYDMSTVQQRGPVGNAVFAILSAKITVKH